MRGALAGTVAAAAWIAAEPVAQRLFGTTVQRRPRARATRLAAALARGRHRDPPRERRRGGNRVRAARPACGWKWGVAVFQLETVATWPLMAAVDRWHPDRRSGAWPPLSRNGRVFAQEAAVHAVFGAVLGLLCRPRANS